MTNRLTSLSATAIVVGVLGCVPAVAQVTPPAAPTAPAGSGAAALSTQRHPLVEQRISELHSHLKINASEQPAFDAFASVMRENASRMNGINEDRRKTMATMSAVDQMKGYQEVAQAHAEDMQRLVPAFERLYDALTPDQKKQADTSFRDFAESGGRGRARS